MANMINCPYCGKLTDPNLDNCPHCGGSTRRQGGGAKGKGGKSTQVCPNCHAVVQEGDIICVACGTNLLTGQQVSPETRETKRRLPVTPLVIVAAVVGVVLVAIVAIVAVIVLRDPVSEARQLAADGRQLEAIETLERHITSNPDDPRAHMALGQISYADRRYTDAAVAFEEAARLESDNADASLLAVASLAAVPRGANTGRQAALLREVVADRPDDLQAWYLLGLTSGLNGDTTAQADAMRRVLELSPGHDGAEQFLGVALAVSGQSQEAVTILEQALAGNQGDPSLRAALGVAKRLAGEPLEAIGHLRGALEEDSPGNETLRLSLALALMEVARYDEALEQFKAISTGQTQQPARQYYYALCLLAAGQRAEALQEFTTLSRGTGDWAGSAALELAKLHLMQGSTDLADESVQLAVRLGAQGPHLDTVRGAIHMRREEYDAAHQAFRRAIAQDPDYAPAHLENGLCYVKRQVFGEGLQELERYLELVESGQADGNIQSVRSLVTQLRQTTNRGN